MVKEYHQIFFLAFSSPFVRETAPPRRVALASDWQSSASWSLFIMVTSKRTAMVSEKARASWSGCRRLETDLAYCIVSSRDFERAVMPFAPAIILTGWSLNRY